MVEGLVGRDLTHEYEQGERALDGVDLTLAAGEFVCVLGPNGSGKSTLLKALSGVFPPTSGRVELDGRALSTVRPRERAMAIASVPQVLAALPDADVESFVMGGRYPYLGLWGSARKEDRDAVARALHEAAAEVWTERRLGELSGGQAQRVLVARALAQEARLLLFDEPTSSLDPEHQVLLFALFARLARYESSGAARRGVLVATHELALASRFADRILLMDAGRIVAAGSVEEVMRAEILEPVYGAHLYYGTAQGATGQSARPMIVPWPKMTSLDGSEHDPKAP